MDRSSHLSVILDLSPTQWLLSAQPSNPHPLSFDAFLSHLLVFLNSHIAYKHENSLAVFGALPGKRFALSFSSTSIIKSKSYSLLFYSSEETGDPSMAEIVQPDPNSYRFFKTVDQSLVHRISREFDILGQPDTEGTCKLSPSDYWIPMSSPKNPVHWLELSPRPYVVCPAHSLVSQRPAHEPRYQPSRTSYPISRFSRRFCKPTRPTYTHPFYFT